MIEQAMQAATLQSHSYMTLLVLACACLFFIFNKANFCKLISLWSNRFTKVSLFAWLLIAANAQANLVGANINNTANLNFDFSSQSFAVDSNSVSSTTAALPTDAVLSLFGFETDGVGDLNVMPNTTVDCTNSSIPSGNSGCAANGPITSGNYSYPELAVLNQIAPGVFPTGINPENTSVPISRRNNFRVGEPLFIQLTDLDQNTSAGDPATGTITQQIDTIEVTISNAAGDNLRVTLSEIDPVTGAPANNTGVFIGYVPTWGSQLGAVPAELAAGGYLNVEQGENISISYTDNENISGNLLLEQAANFEPASKVFFSSDGSVVGDATSPASIELLHGPVDNPSPVRCDEVFAANGQPYHLFDAALCPSPTANFPAFNADGNGGFTLPFIDFTNTDGYFVRATHPAARPGGSISEANRSIIAPGFTIIDELSFESVFTDGIPSPGKFGKFFPIGVDIPKDPIKSTLVLSKKVAKDRAGIGEYVQYQLTAQNNSNSLATFGAQIIDTLPRGLRYVKGTARIDDIKFEPEIASNGRQLTFNLGRLDVGPEVQVKYITEVTANTPIGRAVNTAYLRDQFNNRSVDAKASIEIIDDLLRTRNFIAGRVITNNCSASGELSLQTEQKIRKNRIQYSAYVTATASQLDNLEVIFELPDYVQYQTATAYWGKQRIKDPIIKGRQLVFNVPSPSANWKKRLRFDGKSIAFDQDSNPVQASSKAWLRILPESINEQVSPITQLRAKYANLNVLAARFIFSPAFNNDANQLSDIDKAGLDKAIADINGLNVTRLYIEGYDNNRHLRENPSHNYRRDYRLAEKQAKAILEYIQSKVDIPSKDISYAEIANDKPHLSDEEMAKHQGRVFVDTWQLKDSRSLTIDNQKSNVVNILLSETNAQEDAGIGLNKAGLENVKIYLEDGSYVLTDKEGKYHFEGLKPGTHIVQLDVDSLPNHLEVAPCEKNTRFAGTAFSRFVDTSNGVLWRADFHVREKQLATSNIHALMRSQLEDERIKLEYRLSAEALTGSNGRLLISLPKGLNYISGSSLLNDNGLFEPKVNLIDGETYLSYRNVPLTKHTPLTLNLFVERNQNTEKALLANGQHAVIAAYQFRHNGERKTIGPLKNTLTVSKGQIESTNESARESISLKVLSEEEVSPVPQAPEANLSIISSFDQLWLDKAKPGVEWLMPTENFVPQGPSVSIAIQHGPAHRITATQNGQPVNPIYYAGKKSSTNNEVVISRWRGVSLVDGRNHFVYEVFDENKQQVKRIERDIYYVETIHKAKLNQQYSYFIADGVNPPRIALNMLDVNGNAIRQGLQGGFNISQPYRALLVDDEIDKSSAKGIANALKYEVGPQGIALIELEPTTQAGPVTIDVQLSGKTQQLEVWLSPEPRDWILVGLAEGSVGYGDISNNAEGLDGSELEDGFYDNGRLAFYAKGKVKGKWLLTMAYDTAKEKERERLQQLIDPSTYFTLYGDNTTQAYDAASTEKLYIRIERDQFYALFGDYDTGLTKTELGRYNRSFTGLKSEFQGKYFSYNAFAAEEKFNFVKDEIRGDGTSGLYRLTQKNLVINSEKITLETRDRFRNEVITEAKTLRRFLDYEIDYIAGTILFKEPVFSRDASLNPNFIVVDYETLTQVKGDITAGGRAALSFADDKIEIGSTIISDGSNEQSGDLAALDATVKFNDQYQLNIEAATSSSENGNVDVDGNAYLIELTQKNDNVESSVYSRKNEEGFGLGQQNKSEGGTTKYGATVKAKLDEQFSIDAEVLHQENDDKSAMRDVIEARAIYQFSQTSINGGIRNTRDKDDNEVRQSDLFLFGAQSKFFNQKLTLRFDTETSLSEAENIDYPNRYTLGADYKISAATSIFTEFEVADGNNGDSHTLRSGVKTIPWKNAQISSSVQDDVNEDGSRMFANFGLVQNLPINKRWNMDFGIDSGRTINQDSTATFDSNVPTSSGVGADSDFIALSTGLSYRADKWSSANRLEFRHSSSEDRIGLLSNWQTQQARGIVYGARLQLFDTKTSNNVDKQDLDLSLSLAFRPISSKWIILDRLELLHDSEKSSNGHLRTGKIINNFKANYLFNRRNQWAFNHGVKWVRDNFDGIELSGMTQFAGIEYRHDLTERWDIGTHVSTLISHESGNYTYSYGINTGFNILRNLWFSLGYNIEGFNDGDFDAAEYTAKGVWVKLRFKFDQDTFK